jgi:hypothetical protein
MAQTKFAQAPLATPQDTTSGHPSHEYHPRQGPGESWGRRPWPLEASVTRAPLARGRGARDPGSLSCSILDDAALGCAASARARRRDHPGVHGGAPACVAVEHGTPGCTLLADAADRNHSWHSMHRLQHVPRPSIPERSRGMNGRANSRRSGSPSRRGVDHGDGAAKGPGRCPACDAPSRPAGAALYKGTRSSASPTAKRRPDSVVETPRPKRAEDRTGPRCARKGGPRL